MDNAGKGCRSGLNLLGGDVLSFTKEELFEKLFITKGLFTLHRERWMDTENVGKESSFWTRLIKVVCMNKIVCRDHKEYIIKDSFSMHERGKWFKSMLGKALVLLWAVNTKGLIHYTQKMEDRKVKKVFCSALD